MQHPFDQAGIAEDLPTAKRWGLVLASVEGQQAGG